MNSIANRSIVLAALAVSVAASSSSYGQARLWDGGTDADAKWSTPNNWNTDTAPPVTAVPTEGWRFGSSATELVSDMDAAYSFGQLQFAGVSGYVINSSTGSTMSLSGFNNGTAITFITPPALAVGFEATVNVPITFNTLNPNAAANISEVNRRTINTDTGTITLNGTLTANADTTRNFVVRKIGAGTLNLGAANSITAGVEVNNGVVGLGNDLSLGTATVTVVNGGTGTVRFASTSAAARTIANNFVTSGTGVLAFGGTGTGDVTVNGTINLNDPTNAKPIAVIGGNMATLNGVVSGTAGLIKNNPGTLVLNAVNTYAGITTVGNGIVRLNGSVAGVTTVSGGTLQGTGTIGGQLNVSDVNLADAILGGTLSPGTDDAVGTLAAASAAFGTGGRYLFNIAGATNDLLALSGGLTAASTAVDPFAILVTGAGFNDAVNAQYTLVDGATAVVGFDPAKFTLDTSAFAPGATGTFSLGLADGGTNLVLNYAAVPEPTTFAALLAVGTLTLSRRRR